MIKWIIGNKEWLFSGAGVVLILAIIRLIKFLQNRRKKILTIEKEDILTLTNIPSKSKTKPIELAPALTAKQIKLSFQNAPLLQQPDIQRQFKGLKVSWSVSLVSAQKNKDGSVRLLMWFGNLSESPAITCTVNPEKNPGLGLLYKGHSIDVSGTILNVSENCIELKDVILKYNV